MITLKNIRTLSGPLNEQTFPGEGNHVIEGGNKLLMLPAWVDTDISLGMVNAKSVKEWQQITWEILQTGATTILNNSGLVPTGAKQFEDTIMALFHDANLPLRLYNTFEGVDPAFYNEIGKNKPFAKAITAPVELFSNKEATDRLFQMAAQEEMIILLPLLGYSDSEAALNAVTHGLSLVEKYNTEVSFQHVRTRKELTLIADAKAHEMLIFAEVAFPHLFFTNEEREKKQLDLEGTFLPTQDDQTALWEAINDGTIDILGSGNHLLSTNKLKATGKVMLPLMLDACRHEKLSYERLIALIRINPERIYQLSPTKDMVLVDMESTRPLSDENSPSLLSLWSGRPLAGWPAYVISQEKLYSFVDT